MSMLDHLYLPKTIFKTHSDINGDIVVTEEGSVKRIKVANTTQSMNWDAKIVQKMYWGKSIALLKEHAPDLNNILILGLGGGTLAHLISQAYPGITIYSVEIDKEVVDISRKFFDVDSIPNHFIYTEDACAVIANPSRFGISKNSFDAIYVDIYCGQHYPDLGNTGTFFAGLKNLLKPDGLVLFNRLNLPEFHYEVGAFIEKVEDQFKDVITEAAPGRDSNTNMLILGFNTA